MDVSDDTEASDIDDASKAMAEYTYEYNEYTYEFDIHENKLVNACELYPTSTNRTDFPWLYAVNNKYPAESLDPNKLGKWMVFLPRDCIDETWNKIKAAVASGELWRSEVSTSNYNSNRHHAIMIYTKDFTDVDDVVVVLDYLESSGIKPANAVSLYKTDQQTQANICSGGKEKSFTYTSSTIRHSAMRFKYK